MAKTNALKTPEQIALVGSFLAKHHGQLMSDYYNLSLQTALRVSDCLAITVEDAKDALHTGRLTWKAAKTGKIGSTQINGKAREILERRAAIDGLVYIFEGSGNRTKKGQPVTRQYVSKCLKEAQIALGDLHKDMAELNISTHSIRKSRARALFNNGVSLTLISDMLQHSSDAVTRTYLDLGQNEKDTVAAMEI